MKFEIFNEKSMAQKICATKGKLICSDPTISIFIFTKKNKPNFLRVVHRIKIKPPKLAARFILSKVLNSYDLLAGMFFFFFFFGY